MDIKNSPIGFFDSGVGGLSVLKEAISIMPNENYIYFGDSKNAPYGTKELEELRVGVPGQEGNCYEPSSYMIDEIVKKIMKELI